MAVLLVFGLIVVIALFIAEQAVIAIITLGILIFYLFGWKNYMKIASSQSSDNLYDEAVRVVREVGIASTSFIQEKLGIGYSRAAQLMDMLEKKGVIEHAQGSKPRKVITKNAD